ncbi:hypothetical protein TNCV_2304261 [Trichonephila clavipes]|nr:hypothetical protein TNCV_2304261 [Trichonephila clavipes]
MGGDWYGGDSENATNQQISPSVKPVLHRASWHIQYGIPEDNARQQVSQGPIGCDMKREPHTQTMDDLRTTVDVAWQRFYGLNDRMPLRIEARIAVRGRYIRS